MNATFKETVLTVIHVRDWMIFKIIIMVTNININSHKL